MQIRDRKNIVPSDHLIEAALCARLFLGMALAVLFASLGCGGSSGNNSKPAAAIALTPPGGFSISQGQTIKLTAQTSNDSGAGVLWSLHGDGTLLNPENASVTYVAPTTAITDPNVVVTATSVSDSSVEAYIPITLLRPNVFANVLDVHVNGGPVAGKVRQNAAFTSVTVCIPATTTCQAINGILIDTGSVGLRILSSALPALPAVQNADGFPLSECLQYRSQSYLWGDVVAADVRIAGEVARDLAIQAVGIPANFTAPSDCSDNGAREAAVTQATLGANGILGIGYQQKDSAATASKALYYSCSGGSCSSSTAPLERQVSNPITDFLVDSNGSILQFPALNGAATQLDGTLTFGLATQTNNQLGDATVFTVDSSGSFTTSLASTGQNLTSSVIDSGNNAFFFPDDTLPLCPGTGTFYCPSSSTSVATTQIGANRAESTIQFTVENADALLSSNPTAAAFSGLAGSNGSGSCSGGVGSCQFHWGLPFFYGRRVFIAISGQNIPYDPVASLPPPAPPWFAYLTKF